jgi:hypothetical protein
MPHSCNNNAEYHPNGGSWECSLSRKPELKREDGQRGMIELGEFADETPTHQTADLTLI